MGHVLGCADDSDVKQGQTPSSRKQPAQGDRNSLNLNAPLANGKKSSKKRPTCDSTLVFYKRHEDDTNKFDLMKVQTDYQFQMVYFNSFDVFNEPFIVTQTHESIMKQSPTKNKQKKEDKDAADAGAMFTDQ